MSLPQPIPRPSVRALASTLREAGICSWETGEALRGELERASDPPGHSQPPGPAPGIASAIEMSAQCGLGEFLDRIPVAIPIRPQESIALAPTGGFPIEVRCLGERPLEAHLAARDFSVNAIARNPLDASFVDPLSGLEHLAQRTLHAAPCCRGLLAKRRGLRAARLAANGYRLAPQLRDKLAADPRSLIPPKGQSAAELGPLLLAPDAERGIEVLEAIGIASLLLGAGRRPSHAGINRLPLKLALRLAAMIGPGATRVARRLGFRRSVLASIEDLQRHHPLDQRVDPRRRAHLRRLASNVDAEQLADLVVLRESELSRLPAVEADAIRERLAAICQRIERLKEEDARPPSMLALGGREVMELLGCGPGPEVGRTLGWLREIVRLDPQQNSPERLRVLVEKRGTEAQPTTVPRPGN